MKIATGARKEEKKKEYCVYIYLYTNIQNSNTYNTNKKKGPPTTSTGYEYIVFHKLERRRRIYYLLFTYWYGIYDDI